MAVVNAERAFAAFTAENGMRDGFVQFAADDALMFAPNAVNVKEFYRDQESTPALLKWQPIHAEISSSGDLGWSTGPWDWRAEPTADSADAFGHYNTVWKLQPDSTWKFVIDIGVAHSRHSVPPPPLATRIIEKPKDISGDSNADKTELIQLEYTFASASAADGLAAAYIPLVADDIRFYRMGVEPIQGVAAITNALSAVEGVWTWEPTLADVSRNGDLGYVYGVSTLIVGDTARLFSFMHIWRKDASGLWQLALDIHIQTPPPGQESNG
jgi:ketosteroid isomerase-like protein